MSQLTAIAALTLCACGLFPQSTDAGTVNPCPDPNYPLVCPNQECCPSGFPYECGGKCYTAASPCHGSYVTCGNIGAQSCGTGTYWDSAQGACVPTASQQQTITINATVDFPNPAKSYSWSPLYYAVSRNAAVPATGWGDVNAVCCGGRFCSCCLNGCTRLPLNVTLSNLQTTPPETLHIFAYWSVDGASAGPGPNDPQGSASVNIVSGTNVYNVPLTLCSGGGC